MPELRDDLGWATPPRQQMSYEGQPPAMWDALMAQGATPPSMWPDAAPPDPNYQRDPFDVAAHKVRQPYRNLPAPGSSNMGAIAMALAPTEPWEYGLMAAAPGAGWIGRGLAALPRAVRAGAAAAGFALTPDDAEAGPLSKGLKALFTKSGEPIKGGAYTKQSRNILDEIEAGPKGAGPMDLSGDLRSDVPQVAMERFQPPRGVSPRLQDALADPKVKRGVSESIERGIEMGADKWYHNEPIRREFIKELGPVQGPKDYASYMDMVAATSPRSDVPTNIRNASFYYAQEGDKLPKNLPYPYGHVAQNLHRQNYETLSAPRASELSAGAPTASGWDIFKNPKPASFSQNLQGNLEPGTMDTHAFRNIGMRTKDPRFLETSVSAKYKEGSDPGKDTIVSRYGERDGDTVTFRPQQLHESGTLKLKDALNIPYFWTAKPNANEYAAAEQFYRNLGRDFKIPTADAQAAAWSGGGELTGLGTAATHTFPQLMNERILYTARMRGQDPKQTLSDFIQRKAPLLSVGGGGAALAPGLFGGDEAQAGPADAIRKGIKAYHSSPHDFDRFDINKVGTGQGSNMYGRGIYAAENPAVSGQGGQYWNEFLHHDAVSENERMVAELLKKHGFNRDAALADVQKNIDELSRPVAPHVREMYGNLLKMRQEHKALLESGKPVGPRTYEININAKPDQFLDWDRPMSVQPGVADTMRPLVTPSLERGLAAVERMRANRIPSVPQPSFEDLTGKQAFERLGLPAGNRTEGYARSSDVLRDAGIPGVRYLDQGSRGLNQPGVALIQRDLEAAIAAGNTDKAAIIQRELKKLQPTHNYVINNDKIIDIIKKLGIALPGGGAALASQDLFNSEPPPNMWGR